MIPYGRQNINQADIDAVIDVLQSDFLTQGLKVPTFERAVAQYCGAQYAIAVNSATSALHIACLALGLGQGDYVWTSPITFTASANCALYCGARVDFVDIDPKTYNLSVSALAEKLFWAQENGCLPKIVIPVHLCGEPCDMAAIYDLSQQYGFHIIEDASHAIGAHYRKQVVGQGKYSDITVFSFHPVKIITTAEGGMALTNKTDLAEKMELLRSHGITRDAAKMTHQPDGAWYYQQIDLGYNYRMTELQAALGLSQMQRLEDFIEKRHQLAAQYDDLLRHLPVITPYRHHENRSALHLYPIQILPDSGRHRAEIFAYLRQHDIGVNVHYIPVHTQPYYHKHLGFKAGDFPNAENYYAQCISLPMYFDLNIEQQYYIVQTLTNALVG